VYAEPNAVSNAIGYAKHRSLSHDAVIAFAMKRAMCLKRTNTRDFKDADAIANAGSSGCSRLRILWLIVSYEVMSVLDDISPAALKSASACAS